MASLKVLNCMADIKSEDFNRKTMKDKVEYMNAETYCQDSETTKLLGEVMEKQPVLHNSPLNRLFMDHNKSCWFDNDLPKNRTYENTKMEYYRRKFDKKRGEYPFPYKSMIVWPIRRVYESSSNDKENGFHEHQDILGYLSLTSPSRGVFEHRYDFDLGAAVADALFIVMKEYHRIKFSIKDNC